MLYRWFFFLFLSFDKPGNGGTFWQLLWISEWVLYQWFFSLYLFDKPWNGGTLWQLLWISENVTEWVIKWVSLFVLVLMSFCALEPTSLCVSSCESVCVFVYTCAVGVFLRNSGYLWLVFPCLTSYSWLLFDVNQT